MAIPHIFETGIANAILAQLVEQLIRNEQVIGSNPMDGSEESEK